VALQIAAQSNHAVESNAFRQALYAPSHSALHRERWLPWKPWRAREDHRRDECPGTD
jgi:hypothetical protein